MPKPSWSTQTPRPQVISSSSSAVVRRQLAAGHRRHRFRRDEPDAVELAAAQQAGVEACERRCGAVAVDGGNLGRPPGLAVDDREVEQARRVLEREATELALGGGELTLEVDDPRAARRRRARRGSRAAHGPATSSRQNVPSERPSARRTSSPHRWP